MDVDDRLCLLELAPELAVLALQLQHSPRLLRHTLALHLVASAGRSAQRAQSPLLPEAGQGCVGQTHPAQVLAQFSGLGAGLRFPQHLELEGQRVTIAVPRGAGKDLRVGPFRQRAITHSVRVFVRCKHRTGCFLRPLEMIDDL